MKCYFGLLLLLSSIEPVGEQLEDVLNIHTSYMLIILICLLFTTLSYIIHCKKYLLSCMYQSKSMIEAELEKID